MRVSKLILAATLLCSCATLIQVGVFVGLAAWLHAQNAEVRDLITRMPDARSPGLRQKVVVIRHGEKPPTGNALNERGEQRAQCIADTFAAKGFTHIFAFAPTPQHPSERAVQTVTPLSDAIGVSVDTSVSRDDVDGLVEAIRALPVDAVVLVCWEHHIVQDIALSLGVLSAPEYDGDEFDLMWTIQRGSLTQTHQNC